MTAAFTTRLDAVNRMLATIGQQPVTTLSGSLPPEVSMAVAVLDEFDVETQMRGWRFNTETKDLFPSSGQIAVPTAPPTLRIIVQNDSHDWTIRDNGGLQYLYNLTDHTFTIGTSSLNCRIISLRDFVLDAPECYRRYVTILAARAFGDRVLGDQARHVFTESDERRAYRFLREDEADRDPRTIFDSIDAARALMRRSPVIPTVPHGLD
jgi:hypothetical protein